MISGLLPQTYLHNFVNCIFLKFYCTLSIEPLSLLPYPHFFAWLFFQGIFRNYVTHFLWSRFFHFLSILLILVLFLAVCLLAFLSDPKILHLLRLKAFIAFVTFESLFSLFTSLHKFLRDKSYFNKICTLITWYFQQSICDHDTREHHSQVNILK